MGMGRIKRFSLKVDNNFCVLDKEIDHYATNCWYLAKVGTDSGAWHSQRSIHKMLPIGIFTCNRRVILKLLISTVSCEFPKKQIWKWAFVGVEGWKVEVQERKMLIWPQGHWWTFTKLWANWDSIFIHQINVSLAYRTFARLFINTTEANVCFLPPSRMPFTEKIAPMFSCHQPWTSVPWTSFLSPMHVEGWDLCSVGSLAPGDVRARGEQVGEGWRVALRH